MTSALSKVRSYPLPTHQRWGSDLQGESSLSLDSSSELSYSFQEYWQIVTNHFKEGITSNVYEEFIKINLMRRLRKNFMHLKSHLLL